MIKADFVTGLAFVALGLAALAGALAMPRFEALGANPYTVPGIVPGLLGGVIAVLGAVLALAGKLRQLAPLKRRAECGNPCHLCERHCPIQAIEPSGQINMTECFYCLDCQVVYYDDHLCPPLIATRKRRDRIPVAVPAE